MIVRLLKATVSADRAGPFNALMRSQLPILRRYPGLVYVKLARRITGDVEEVLLYEEWRDTASLYGWTGPEVTRPRLVPGAEDLVNELSVVHYEALDIDLPQDDLIPDDGVGHDLEKQKGASTALLDAGGALTSATGTDPQRSWPLPQRRRDRSDR